MRNWLAAKFFCHSWLSGYHVYQLSNGLCDKCRVHIFIKIPVCVHVLCMRAHPHTYVWKET